MFYPVSCFPAAFAESPLLPSRPPPLTVSTCDDITATTTSTRPPLNNDNLITPNSATTTSTRQMTQTPGILTTNKINSDPIFQKRF